jgi:hypothetical protein
MESSIGTAALCERMPHWRATWKLFLMNLQKF